MKKIINYKPNRTRRIMLGFLPFLILIIIYMMGSEARLAENPNDKLLPSFSQMGDAMYRLAFEPSKRTDELILWNDTLSSLLRLASGVIIAATIGLFIGLLTGALPLASAGFSPLLTVISLVPHLALLPILFIVVGLGEMSKVVLIAVGITPFIARDIQNSLPTKVRWCDMDNKTG